MELGSGEEHDGITYRVHLDAPQWVATVTHPDGRTLTERWHWAYEPRFGPDGRDTHEAEKRVDRMIMTIRGVDQPSPNPEP